MSLQPNFEVLWIEQVLKKPSKTNASKHSIHFPPFQGHKKSIRNSLFSNSLSKMLHFFSMKFATTLDFTGFPVISHLFTDGLTLECPFVRYSVKLHGTCRKRRRSIPSLKVFSGFCCLFKCNLFFSFIIIAGTRSSSAIHHISDI